MKTHKHFAIIISGPTASGKTPLSQAIADKVSGEIINADSMQVYKELCILSARPKEFETTAIPHHLYGHISILSPYSVGTWLTHTNKAIKKICNQNKVPIICGGTGLYLKVLREGIARTPSIDKSSIKKATSLYDEKGKTAALSVLQKINPKINPYSQPKDRQRIIRALSVYFATGRSLKDWQKLSSSMPQLRVSYFAINLIPPREGLYCKINQRFDQMITDGAVDEAKAIMDLNPDPELPAMKAVGLPQILNFLSGTISLETAILDAKKSTRNLAKRQLSWLRNHSQADLILTNFATKDSVEDTLNAIEHLL